MAHNLKEYLIMIILFEDSSDIQMEMNILEIYIMAKDKVKDPIFVYKKIKDTKDNGKMISKMEKVMHSFNLGSIVFSNGD
jgi:hypothetical protein